MKNRQSFLLEDLKNKIDLNNMVQKSTEISELVQQPIEKIRSNYSKELWEKLKSNILVEDDLLQLLEKISINKRSVQIQFPIYISSRDGLDPANFQNNINTKGNVLFIAKTKNQKAVGGFCSFKQNSRGDFQNDNNQESFLFLQNSDQDRFRFSFFPSQISMFQQFFDQELIIGVDLQAVTLRSGTNQKQIGGRNSFGNQGILLKSINIINQVLILQSSLKDILLIKTI